MKEITVISGKGETGKTSFAGSLRLLLQCCLYRLRCCGCCQLQSDHEAESYRKPMNLKFPGGFYPRNSAAAAGLSRELCRFGAITEDSPKPFEGCGFCYHACPEKVAIDRAHLFV